MNQVSYEKIFVPNLADIPVDYYNRYKYYQRKDGSFSCDTEIHYNIKKINPFYYILFDVEKYGLCWGRYIPQVKWERFNNHNPTDIYIKIHKVSVMKHKSDLVRIQMTDEYIFDDGKQVHLNLGWCDYNKYIVKNQSKSTEKSYFLVSYRNIRKHLPFFPTEVRDFLMIAEKEKIVNYGYYAYQRELQSLMLEPTHSATRKIIIANNYLWDKYLLYSTDYQYQTQLFRKISLTDYPKINKNHNVVLNDDVWGLIKQFMGIYSYSFRSDPIVKSLPRNKVLQLCMRGMTGVRAYREAFLDKFDNDKMLQLLDDDANTHNMSDDTRHEHVKFVLENDLIPLLGR